MTSTLSSFVYVLGWSLIHFLWQGLLIGVATAIVLMLFRNSRPQLRYAIGCIALALCLLVPAFGTARGLLSPAFAMPAAGSDSILEMTFTAGASNAGFDSWQSMLQPWLPTIVIAWSMIAGVLALRMMMGLAWIGRIVRSRSSACDAVWQTRLDQLARAFGIERAVRLRVVTEFQSPVVAGWWRPAVLVPASLIARMPPELLEALLAHELAHIRRHDYLINMMQSAIEALLFYHPIVWWLSRRIRIEREQIADALAAEALGEPRRLAVALGELAIFQTESPVFSLPRLASSANGGNLMSRIQNLLRPSHHALSWKMFLPLAGLMAACASLAAIGMTVYANDSLEEAGTTLEITAPPAPAAAPLLAMASPAQNLRGNVHTSRRPGEAYAVVRAGSDELLMSGHSGDIEDVKALKGIIPGDFLWVRRGEKTYVIQDPATVARVIEAWKPAENLGTKMEAVGDRMEIPSREMEEIGKRMEAIGERGRPYEAEMEEVSAKMEAVGREQAALGMKMEQVARQFEQQAGAADLEEMSRKMEAIQQEMEPSAVEMERLAAIMEKHAAALESALEPMEALGREMEQASEPMEALSREMEVFGAQMEALAEEADQKVKSLIEEALASGRAVPTDSLPRN